MLNPFQDARLKWMPLESTCDRPHDSFHLLIQDRVCSLPRGPMSLIVSQVYEDL